MNSLSSLGRACAVGSTLEVSRLEMPELAALARERISSVCAEGASRTPGEHPNTKRLRPETKICDLNIRFASVPLDDIHAMPIVAIENFSSYTRTNRARICAE